MLHHDWATLVAIAAALWLVVPLGGYWCVLRLVSVLRRARPVTRGYSEPVTVVIAAYNEERNVGRCLQSLAASVPEPRIQRIIIADDGSTDGTIALAQGFATANPSIDVLILQNGRLGKNATLGRAFPYVETDVAILTDADIIFEPNTLSRLVDAMADESVAIVVGRTIRPKRHADGGSEGEAVHQRVISSTAMMESQISSTILSNGHAYAVRREFLESYPNNAVSDDFYLNLRAINRGYRVVFASEACVQEIRENTLQSEYDRTRRTIGAGVNAILQNARLLWSLHRWESWFLYGHRVARYLSPVALIVFLGALAVMATSSTLWLVMFGIVVGALLAGMVGAWLEFNNRSMWFLRFPAYYLMMNLAAAVAMLQVVVGVRFDQWRPSVPSQEKP